MKEYIKPSIEVVNAEVEGLLVNATNQMGDGEQLSKEQTYLFDDSNESLSIESEQSADF